MNTRGSDQAAAGRPQASGMPGSGARISVALCTYNGARFLEAQLASYLAQTRLPDELVACDDGSTDGTQAILERFAKRAPFPVRVEHNPTRLGSTKNFEKAVGLCAGALIATSDQDDVWLPHKLAASEAAFATEPQLGLVFGDAEVVDDDLRPLGHTMWQAIHLGPKLRRRIRGGKAFPILLRQWLVTGATMTFRASYRSHVLPIPESWIHDGWIAFIIGALAPIGVLDGATVQYRQHAAQQIGGKKLGWRELYRLAQNLGPEHFRLAHERFSLARERLRTLAPRLRRPEYLGLLDEKVEHQRRRLAIAESRSRTQKVLWTLGELAHGRYHRYSPGISHCFKDLLL